MIILSQLSLAFGDRKIFDHLSTVIHEQDRIGLVGRNGYGKSTLLKTIAGQQPLDGGTISIIGNKRVAYLNQEVMLSSELSAITFVVQEAQKDPALVYTPEALIRADADKILRGLGFNGAMLHAPINSLSGGWKMRVVLAHLLTLHADFYLFDEPTNHLDIFAKDWFLSFLRQAPFGFLLVCHEKRFLNMLCTKILALDTPQGKLYQGNYDAYATAVVADLQALEAAYIQQQKVIAQKKETIARFRASANRAKMAQSMLKELERMELIDMPPKPPTMQIPLPEIPPSGSQVLTVYNLAGGYNAKQPVFTHGSFAIQRGEKVAIVAANGVGKTTLIHTIAGELPKISGTITLGPNVLPALFHQEQAPFLTAQNSIWQEVNSRAPHTPDATIRALLGSFLFSGDDIDKKIAVLSGGEKSRVGLINVLLQRANLLILDEPTNHLDIPSKEVLLKTLQKYTGTILFVSHDHDFINALATSIIELTPTGTRTYPGNYDDYLQQKAHEQIVHDVATPLSPQHPTSVFAKATPDASPLTELRRAGTQMVTAPPLSHDTQKKIKKLEQKMEKLTKEREAILTELEKHAYGTPEFTERTKRLQEIDAEQPKLFDEWCACQT